MAGGTPLNDDDRAPWLATLAELLASHLACNEAAVLSRLACSALKRAYRDVTGVDPGDVQFVYFCGGVIDTILAAYTCGSGHC